MCDVLCADNSVHQRRVPPATAGDLFDSHVLLDIHGVRGVHVGLYLPSGLHDKRLDNLQPTERYPGRLDQLDHHRIKVYRTLLVKDHSGLVVGPHVFAVHLHLDFQRRIGSRGQSAHGDGLHDVSVAHDRETVVVGGERVEGYWRERGGRGGGRGRHGVLSSVQREFEVVPTRGALDGIRGCYVLRIYHDVLFFLVCLSGD